jgi:hypothetical protein
LSHVELIGNGGSSNVKPVWVIWGEILHATGLVVVGPLINIIIYKNQLKKKKSQNSAKLNKTPRTSQKWNLPLAS